MPSKTMARAFTGLAAALGLCIAHAQAQPAYPHKPIHMVIGYGPGGTADIIARAVAERMSASLGQQVVIENRPGAGQAVAAATVAKAAPDGYTLFLMASGHASSVALFKSLPYDIVRDFSPISTFGFFDIVLLANKGSRLNSVSEVLAEARANPDKFNVGTPNIGSGQHLSAELFKSLSGLPLTIVPYTTTPLLVTAVKSKDVQVAFEMLVPVNAMVRAGELKPIAVSSASRFPGLPDVPTFMESGLPNYQVSSWNGLAAPASTPKAIVDRLNAAVNAALTAPDMVQRFQAMGMTLRGSTPDELKTLLAEEIAKWEQVVKTAKIEKQ
jgi:tripartite-type tricarboxylate transporter receptor subunit TctC